MSDKTETVFITKYALTQGIFEREVESITHDGRTQIKRAQSELLANARLIAAAPETAAERDHLRAELLELNEAHFAALVKMYRLRVANEELLAALEHILAGALSLPRWAEDEGRAAIAKAKGGAA